MSVLIRLGAALLSASAFAGQHASVPKIGAVAAPLASASSLKLPQAPLSELPGLPGLAESAVTPGVAASVQAAAAQPISAPSAAAAQSEGRAPNPLAAKDQLEIVGQALTKGAGGDDASPDQADALGGAFDNQDARQDSVSPFHLATVYHLQNDGGTLGAEKRGHQDFRNEEVPFPVPPELRDDVPSSRENAPANWTGLISLHLHSIYSDGTLAPSQLMDEAFNQGVRIVALTDHDTTAGLAEAKKRAQELGMTFIAGEEMTARGGVHIGALGLDASNPDLLAHNERVRQNRLARAQNIIDHLNAQFRDRPSKDEERGLVLTLDEVKKHSKHDEGGTIEIPAIARVLLDHKLIEHVDDAYDTYLTKDILTDPKIEPDPTVDEVLEVIKKAGGKAFLNHPYTVRANTPQQKDAKVKAMLPKFDGIEAYRDSNAESPAGRDRFDQRVAKYLSWGKDDNLLVGNGADYHGPDTHLDHLVVYMPKHYASDLLDGLGIPEAKKLIDDKTPPAPQKSPIPLAGVAAAPLLMNLAAAVPSASAFQDAMAIGALIGIAVPILYRMFAPYDNEHFFTAETRGAILTDLVFGGLGGALWGWLAVRFPHVVIPILAVMAAISIVSAGVSIAKRLKRRS